MKSLVRDLLGVGRGFTSVDKKKNIETELVNEDVGDCYYNINDHMHSLVRNRLHSTKTPSSFSISFDTYTGLQNKL